jgi:VWFA-related protein
MLLPLAALLLSQEVVIRSDTRLVEISVSVTDKQGRAVSGLTRDDFEVFDNRAPQPIAIFSSQPEAAPPAPPTSPGSFSNRLGSAREGYAVVLLDWLNTDWGDQTQARAKVIEMLGRIDAADHVALYVLDRNVRILHEFGAGREALLKKLASLRGDGSALSDEKEPSEFEAAFSPSFTQISPQERIFRLDRRILNTLGALEAIAGHLAAVPGKKSLVWVSAGFPISIDGSVVRGARPGERTYTDEFNRLLRKLNNSGIAVYPIDARGLMPRPGNFAYLATMLELASRTGGRAWYNRNDLDAGMRLALDELRTTYTLGYYAPENSNRPGFHQLRVRVRRPGVTLRHREGYWVEAPAKAAAQDVKAELQRALLAPVDSGAVTLAAGAARTGEVLKLRVLVDPAGLDLEHTGGRWKGAIQMLMRFAAGDGTQVGNISSHSVTLDLRESTYEAARRQGFAITQPASIPPRADSLRVLVRDQRSGAIGTLSIPLRAVPAE